MSDKPSTFSVSNSFIEDMAAEVEIRDGGSGEQAAAHFSFDALCALRDDLTQRLGESDLMRVESLFAAIGAPFDRGEPSEASDFPAGEAPPREGVIALRCGQVAFLFTDGGAFLGVSWFTPSEELIFDPRRGAAAKEG